VDDVADETLELERATDDEDGIGRPVEGTGPADLLAPGRAEGGHHGGVKFGGGRQRRLPQGVPRDAVVAHVVGIDTCLQEGLHHRLHAEHEDAVVRVVPDGERVGLAKVGTDKGPQVVEERGVEVVAVQTDHILQGREPDVAGAAEAVGGRRRGRLPGGGGGCIGKIRAGEAEEECVEMGEDVDQAGREDKMRITVVVGIGVQVEPGRDTVAVAGEVVLARESIEMQAVVSGHEKMAGAQVVDRPERRDREAAGRRRRGMHEQPRPPDHGFGPVGMHRGLGEAGGAVVLAGSGVDQVQLGVDEAGVGTTIVVAAEEDGAGGLEGVHDHIQGGPHVGPGDDDGVDPA